MNGRLFSITVNCFLLYRLQSRGLTMGPSVCALNDSEARVIRGEGLDGSMDFRFLPGDIIAITVEITENDVLGINLNNFHRSRDVFTFDPRHSGAFHRKRLIIW